MRPALTHALKTQLIFCQSPGQAGVQAALLALCFRKVLRVGSVAVAGLHDDEFVVNADQFSGAAGHQGNKRVKGPIPEAGQRFADAP